MASHSPAADQLVNFAKSVKGTPGSITTKSGNPVGVKTAIQTAGEKGPALLQDAHFLDEISSFARERIPERVVHAKGAGALGYFEVTHDITNYCAAKLFDTVGKKTPVALRFSTVAGEVGSPDTVRDPRGFALRFYSEEGNWDIVGNNTPIFFIKDAALFPSFIHILKRNPETHLKDPNMFWDFVTLRHECVHQTLFTYSDRGIPDGYRFMNGYGSHTFKMINDQGISHYVKFHFKTNQGIKNISPKKAEQLCATEPDYAIRDLYDAIAKGDYPSWSFFIQAMTMDEAEKEEFDPFDMTKVWPHSAYPLIPVGQLVLNRNPKNYFTEVEQLGFNPANLVPGVEPSPDKMLQGRLFAYGDTQRHRLGANYLQIPVNCPFGSQIKNYQRDGPQNISDNQGGAPNYFPNSFSGPVENPKAKFLQSKWTVSGDVVRHDSGESNDNYAQARVFYTRILTDDERARVAENLAEHLRFTVNFIQERAIKMFTRTHPDLGKKVADSLARYKRFHQANL